MKTYSAIKSWLLNLQTRISIIPREVPRCHPTIGRLTLEIMWPSVHPSGVTMLAMGEAIAKAVNKKVRMMLNCMIAFGEEVNESEVKLEN